MYGNSVFWWLVVWTDYPWNQWSKLIRIYQEYKNWSVAKKPAVMECEQQKSAECTLLEEKRSGNAGSLKCNKLSSLPDHTSSPNIVPLQHIYKVYPERWVILIAVFLLNIANYAHWVAFPSVNKVRLKIWMPIWKTTKNCQFFGFSFEFVLKGINTVKHRFFKCLPSDLSQKIFNHYSWFF